MTRILKTLTLAGIAYGLWVWLRSLLDEPPHPIDREAPATPAPQASSKPATASKPEESSASSASSNGGGATKAELYERAQELDIEGRSKMSKAELERAIRDAG